VRKEQCLALAVSRTRIGSLDNLPWRSSFVCPGARQEVALAAETVALPQIVESVRDQHGIIWRNFVGLCQNQRFDCPPIDPAALRLCGVLYEFLSPLAEGVVDDI